MEKRAILAIALSILVLLLFRYLEERRLAELARRKPPLQKREMVVSPSIPTAQPAPSEKAAQRLVAAQSDTRAGAKPVVVDGKLYRAVLDNRGGVLTSWQLKNYRSIKGELFEMIAAGHSPELRPYPGSLVSDDPSINGLVNGEFYEVLVEEESRSGAALNPPLAVSLRLRRGGLAVAKRYHFHADNYIVDYSASVERDGKPEAMGILLAQDIGSEHEHLLNPSIGLQAVSSEAGKVKRRGPPKDENEAMKIEGEVRWVGLDMLYFTVIAVPARPFNAFGLQKKPVKTVGLDGSEVSRDLMRLTLPTQGASQFQLFLGPKDQEFLDAVKGYNLSEVIDFGMFSFLVRPLLFSLKWIDRYVHNYGVSIIILTLVLTLLLFPFRIKQVLSMQKMQVVQPKIKEIQEKYKRYKKTDPRRAEMNQEIMAIYKKHNVNPLGGCLPLLLQMPLLFAFYQLLAASIELRQAPFVLWIHDLSSKDPYYVLPIIMGVTMLISQKMTPVAPGADPTQAKILMMMPVVLTVMFLNVSSGLNLYFLCSNIFQIAFQKLAERWIGGGKSATKSSK